MKKGLSSAHPLVSMTYYIGAAVLAITFYHPYFLITELALMIMINLMQDGGREMRRFVGVYLMTGGLMFFINPLLSHRGATILFYLFDNPVTLESILFGAITAVSITAVMLVFTSFGIIIDADKILFLFSWFLENTTMVLLLTLRFVPLFRIRIREIREVQKTRAYAQNGGKLIMACKEGMQVMNILLARSLEDAVYTAQSMRARGYHLTRKRTFYFRYNWNKKDITIQIVLTMLLAFITLLYAVGAMNYSVYPRFQWPQITKSSVIAYVLYTFFLSTPFLLEGGAKHGVY